MSGAPQNSGFNKLRVAKIGEKSFSDLAESWCALLKQSNADPLFMSWTWLFSWWATWGHDLGLELLLLEVIDQKANLVGIAPLYRHRYRTPVGISVGRLHFLGNAWRIGDTVRTEYVGLIAHQGFEESVAEAVASYLRSEPWDEMVICDASRESLGWLKCGFQKVGQEVSEVPRDQAAGICIHTAGNFENWLSFLGRNTRLKAYNRRKVFENEHGGTEKVVGSSRSERESFFEYLNDMHVRRWGKPCFGQKAVTFHLDFLERLSSDQAARLSLLKYNGRVVAAQYDVEAGRRRYNLQSGFEEHFDKRISLGTLHMGYAIESAFRDPQIENYDLLAGEGKNTFYKEHYKGEHVGFYTRHYTRNRLLRLVYRWQVYLPGAVRRVLNRAFRL